MHKACIWGTKEMYIWCRLMPVNEDCQILLLLVLCPAKQIKYFISGWTLSLRVFQSNTSREYMHVSESFPRKHYTSSFSIFPRKNEIHIFTQCITPIPWLQDCDLLKWQAEQFSLGLCYCKMCNTIHLVIKAKTNRHSLKLVFMFVSTSWKTTFARMMSQFFLTCVSVNCFLYSTGKVHLQQTERGKTVKNVLLLICYFI